MLEHNPIELPLVPRMQRNLVCERMVRWHIAR
jgi:hypothetical protein